MGIFQYNNVLHSTEREKLNMKTGVRTTQHRMEKVRRELHLPARHMYQVVLTYWMYLQRVTCHLVFKMEKPSQMYSKDSISRTT